jgi:translocation and assembly module TamB
LNFESLLKPRRLAWVGAGIATFLLVAIVGLYAAVLSSPGRAFIAEQVSARLSDEAMTVEMSPPEGNLFGTFSVEEVSVATRQGGRLTVSGAAIDWSPLALLRGRLAIESVEVRRILDDGFLDAPPESGEDSESGALPGLEISVGRIRVGEIDLRSSMFGDGQRMALDGSLSVEDALAAAAATLRLTRLDGGDGHAEATLDYRSRPARFAAHLAIAEPQGGLIGSLAGLPKGTPLSVSVDGDGPPENWRGTLSAAATGFAKADAALIVAISEPGITVSIDGGGEVLAAIPETLRNVLASRISLRTDISYRTGEAISVSALHAESGDVSVQGNGSYRLADGGIDGAFDIKAGLGQPDAFGVVGLSLRDARVGITLSGTMAEPVLAAQLAAAAPSFEPVHATAVTGHAAVAPLQPGTWSVKGAVKLDGLDLAETVPPGLLGSVLDLQFDGFALEDGNIPHLGVSFSSGPLSGTASVTIGQDGAADGDYSVRLTTIRPLGEVAGFGADGVLAASGRYSLDALATALRADTAGSLQQVSGAPERLAALFGQESTFGATVVWKSGAGVTVSDASVVTPAGRIAASGTLDAAMENITAEYSISIGDASRLSRLAGMPLAGSVNAAGTAGGKMAAPQIRAQIQVANLAVDGNQLGDIALGASAAVKGASVAADLRLGGKLRGQALGGDIALAVTPETLRASRIDLRLGGASLNGKLDVRFDGMKMDGDLVAQLGDLADLPLQDSIPKLAGAAAIRATMRSDAGQQLVVAVNGRQVGVFAGTSDEIRSESITGSFRIGDPFGDPSIDGTARLAKASLAGGSLDSVDVTLRGGRTQLGWAVTADGKLAVPVAVAAAGTLSLRDPALTVDVAKFEGEADGHPFALLSPLQVRLQDESLTSSTFALSLGPGRLDAEIAMTPQTVTGSARLTGIPASIATMAAPNLALDGDLSSTLLVRGSRQRPIVSLAVTGRDIRPHGVPREDFAGLSLDMSVEQGDASLSAVLDIAGSDDMRVHGDVRTVPLVALDDPWIAPIGLQPLAGSVTATGELALVDRLVGLGGDRLVGAVSAQASVSGTLRQPAVHGDVRLTGGAYEGVATGVVLRQVEGHIAFTGNEARIVSLSAGDVRDGTLTGSGAVAISDAENMSGNLQIALNRFTVLQRPELDAVASGTIALAGSLAAPKLVGKLTVDNSEIRIPDKLPASVAELNVVEINGPGTVTAGPATAEEPSLSHTLAVALDLDIDFPGRSFVRGRGLDSEWGGKLHVGGDSDKPVLAGALNAVRGTFAFAGKTFVVKSGSVTFLDGPAAEPEIDAVAEASLPNLVARVRIQGKASQPGITVSSEPSLPQEEVLAQILSGRSTGQLSAVQALQLAQTAATLSGTGGANIVDKIRQTLGVDVLNVEADGATGSGATLKAGKYVSDDVFLSVSQGTEPGSQKVGVEVDVLPNVSVDIGVGGAASGNVGVNWKYDY